MASHSDGLPPLWPDLSPVHIRGLLMGYSWLFRSYARVVGVEINMETAPSLREESKPTFLRLESTGKISWFRFFEAFVFPDIRDRV